MRRRNVVGCLRRDHACPQGAGPFHRRGDRGKYCSLHPCSNRGTRSQSRAPGSDVDLGSCTETRLGEIDVSPAQRYVRDHAGERCAERHTTRAGVDLLDVT